MAIKRHGHDGIFAFFVSLIGFMTFEHIFPGFDGGPYLRTFFSVGFRFFLLAFLCSQTRYFEINEMFK